MSSTQLRAHEFNLTNPACVVLRYAPLGVEAFDSIECSTPSDGISLSHPPGGVGERDWSLLAVAREAASEGANTMLLTDDELLLGWAVEEFFGSADGLEVFPSHTVDFLERLYDCGALTYAELGRMLEAEAQHLNERLAAGNLTRGLMQTKSNRIQHAVRRSALRESRRSG